LNHREAQAFSLSESREYDVVIRVTREVDIAVARQMAKQLAQDSGFSLSDTTKIATAVSELARNIYRYAKTGVIMLRKKESPPGMQAIEIVAFDQGPGIEDVDLAMSKGYSTFERSLGIGLAGVRRLMDSFVIKTEVGVGTEVRVEKRRRTF